MQGAWVQSLVRELDPSAASRCSQINKYFKRRDESQDTEPGPRDQLWISPVYCQKQQCFQPFSAAQSHPGISGITHHHQKGCRESSSALTKPKGCSSKSNLAEVICEVLGLQKGRLFCSPIQALRNTSF